MLPCFLLSGCSFSEKSVVDITQGETIGGTTTYTISYSDGTSSKFTTTNGTNGEDGKDLTVASIKAYCEENDIDFKSFLKEYFEINLNPVKNATNKAINSAVSFVVTKPCESSFHHSSKSIYGGAGVIYKMDTKANNEIDENGYSYIVTNNHVVEGVTDIVIFQFGAANNYKNLVPYSQLSTCCYTTIEFSDYAVMGELVGTSGTFDLAVVKVRTSDLLKNNPNTVPVTISSGYSLGDTAIAIGNPLVEGLSVTEGIVSVLSEYIKCDDYNFETRVMRIDTPINGGNSGGGLFNIDGELIGIVNAKKENAAIDNIGYAIPVEAVTKVVNNIIDNESASPIKAKKLYLDITMQVKDSKAEYNSDTDSISIEEVVTIKEVKDGGVGKLMGLQVGDIVTKLQINSTFYDIKRLHDFGEILFNVRVGDKIKVYGIRENQDNVTLGSLETEEGVLESYIIDPDTL